MIIIDQAKDEWLDYIPEWRGNRELAKKDQITAKVKLLMQEEIEFMAEKTLDQERKGFRNKKGTSQTQVWKTKVFENIKEITNVFVKEKTGKKEITTMQDLRKYPVLKGLYQEFANAIDGENYLDSEEEKN